MRDSGAWKPFALLLGTGFCWLVNKLFTLPATAEPDTTVTTRYPEVGLSFNAGTWLTVLVIGGLLLFVILAMAKSAARDRRYVSPSAEYIAPGVIEVRGTVEHMQRNWGISSTQSWTHIGHNHWRVDMLGLNARQTQDLVREINE